MSVQSYELAPPAPSPASKCGSSRSPPRTHVGQATLACMEGGGGTQFRQQERHSDMIPSRGEGYKKNNVGKIGVLLPENLRAHLQLSV